MRSIDPVWQWRLALALAVLASAGVVVGSVTLSTSRATPQNSVSARSALPSVAPTTEIGTTDPNAWSHPAWQSAPAVTPPTAIAPPPKKRDIRLVAIMPRRNRLVAALDMGKGTPLMYLGVGESQAGVVVTSITATRVELDVDQEHLTLAVKP